VKIFKILAEKFHVTEPNFIYFYFKTNRQFNILENQLQIEISRIYPEIPTAVSPKTFHVSWKLICD